MNTETLTRRILRTFDRATASDLESGARWYDEAGSLASQLSDSAGYSREQVAAVIAHLSPRTSWDRNVASAVALVREGGVAARELGAIGDNVDRAVASLDWEDPVASFGPKAHKTRSFYLNILGDREAVTVDVWAARVAGVTEKELRRVGVYDQVAHAYRLAARRRGVDPSTMQAVTWVVARGGRAA
jgi:hypothetical protein